MSVELLGLDGISRYCNPNFIYNRPDLFTKHGEIEFVKTDEAFVSIQYVNDEAVLGTWLNPIGDKALRSVVDWIFRKKNQVKMIRYSNALTKVDTDYTIHNHFHIMLPNSEEELHARLSSKGRYNLRRERRILEQNFQDVRFEEYDLSSGWQEKYAATINRYFELKSATHEREYGLTPKQYIDRYHVTNIYTLCLDDKLSAMILSCEQCENVYIENITYDLELSRFSLGQILYDQYLIELIKKNKKALFLGGGDLEYKRRYGSIEQTVFSGTVSRGYRLRELKEKIRNVVRSKG